MLPESSFNKLDTLDMVEEEKIELIQTLLSLPLDVQEELIDELVENGRRDS